MKAVVCVFTTQTQKYMYTLRLVVISLIRHDKSPSEVIIHPILALQVLILSSQMPQKAQLPMP